MQNTDTRERFVALDERADTDAYNYERFRTRHLWSDAVGTVEKRGILPGEAAPDFELPSITGARIRLSDLRDRPVLLHFGSGT